MTAIKAKFVKVTPAKAKEWLEGSNEANRSRSEIMVDRYAADMKAGRWVPNGETIVFNGSSLLDGQHRLAAVVKAGVPVEMLVVTGVPSKAAPTIDTGKSRSIADFLRMRGNINCNNLGHALRLLYAYERGNPFTVSGVGGGTRHQLGALLDRSPGLAEAVHDAVTNRSPIVSPGIVAFCRFVFSKRDKEQAAKFALDLTTGDGVRASSPVGMLRQRLVEESAGGRRMDSRLVVYLIFRAWNATRTGERLHRLQVPRSALEGKPMSIDLPEVA